jgi:regulator of ribonuclease activity A
MSFKTADLCDAHEDVQVCEPLFRDFGGSPRFSGPISTIKCFEDNSLVRQAVNEPGDGRVLVVDAGGSMRCAMLGDLLAAAAVANGWTGVVMYGLIRDSVEIGGMALGVKALGTLPLKSVKRGIGERDVPVRFGGVTFTPGDHVYADEDGLICSSSPLTSGS